MRFKFRIWDNEKKKFFEPTFRAYEHKIEELLITQSGELIMRTTFGASHESLFPDRFQLMQWTGLQDKHGTDIWEKDVVERDGKCFVIEWGTHGWIAVGEFSTWSFWTDDVFEVVGNVHQNSKLIGRMPSID